MTSDAKPLPQFDNRRQLAELLLLRDRLKLENERELLERIKICQEPIVLMCLSCRAKKKVAQRCKKRWCPCCAKQLASVRSMEMEYIVERMRHPLFVTLTMRHGSKVQPDDVRILRKAFGKLRHRKLWKCRTKGGVASVELTNQGGGWHPHLHAVIDCEWLAVKTPRPYPSMPRENKKALYKLAAEEMNRAWCAILKQDTASIKIKRANKLTIAKEVTKYTVKNEDLVMSEEPIGDIIRSLDKTRAFWTFGEAHGQKCSEIRKAARAYAKAKRKEWVEENPEVSCCEHSDLTLEMLADNPRWDSLEQSRRRIGEEKRAVRLACEPARKSNNNSTLVSPSVDRNSRQVFRRQKFFPSGKV